MGILANIEAASPPEERARLRALEARSRRAIGGPNAHDFRPWPLDWGQWDWPTCLLCGGERSAHVAPKEREDLRYMSALTDGQLRALARYSPRKSPRVTLTPCRCVLEVRPCLEHLATPIGYACARCGHRAECHGKRENRDV
jgi:hypothetical protein